MTTLAAWVSVDSEKPSACYLVSDSRITWPNGHWDSGQKLFVSTSFPVSAYVTEGLPHQGAWKKTGG